MGENSKIEWCDHTFNPWVGCTKLTPACDNCYAEGWARRTGQSGLWSGERRRTSAANWKQPLKWNRDAAEAGKRPRVFCASLADVFDNQVPREWRDDLWVLIRATPDLDWLLLTKRPENIKKMLPPDWGAGYSNVWLGTTAEDQKRADHRIPHLLQVPATIRFVSYEPAIGLVDFSRWTDPACGVLANPPTPRLSWIIAGGESGPRARPAHPDWFRSVRDQCSAAGVAFFFKQWGEWIPHRPQPGGDLGSDCRRDRVRIVHRHHHTSEELLKRSFFSGDAWMERVGKKRAGRLLDGREYNEFPSPSDDHNATEAGR